MRPEPDCRVFPKKFVHEELQGSFQISHTHVLIYIEAFNLVKLRAVSRVDFIATVGRARRDDANWRGRRLHRPNLDGGGVGSKESPIRQIEGVLFVAGWMISRRVQRVETMPFIFDVGTVCEGEPHSSENADSALQHLVEGMKRTPLGRCAGKRNIDVRERG